jgi:signal peptidase I
MKNFLSFTFEILKIVIIALLIVVPVRFFLFQPFVVKGESMEPNFSDGDYLIVDEITYRFNSPKRGEVIVFESPGPQPSRYIKRVIGLPGETIEIEEGIITVYNQKGEIVLYENSYIPISITTTGDIRVSLQEGEYFVLGDNRIASFDSRKFGPLREESIIGRAYLRAWPFDSFSKIYVPSY